MALSPRSAVMAAEWRGRPLARPLKMGLAPSSKHESPRKTVASRCLSQFFNYAIQAVENCPPPK